MNKWIKSTVAVLLCALALTACNTEEKSESSAVSEISEVSEASQAVGEDSTSATEDIFAMDTFMTVTAYGTNAKKAVSEAIKEIQRLDALLSVKSESGEVYAINQNGGGTLSKDTTVLVEKALWIYETTGGAYDITVYPLMQLWGFTGDAPSLPESDRITEVLKKCGSDQLTYKEGVLTLGKGQGIDFGGIAKGYTSARIMEIFEENNVESGVVSLGGNVQCFRRKTDGTLWRCGITDPDSPDDGSLIGKVEIEDKAVITSGGYERFFTDEKSGETYHHIMDPKTGYPAKNGLKSVTIVSDDGTLADGLSTACFVLGAEDAVKYWKKYSEKFDMILMTDEGKLVVTGGLENSFSSDLEFEIVKKES